MTSADNYFWTLEQVVSYYQVTIVHYIGFCDKGMYLAGGCGSTNRQGAIEKTNYLNQVYIFARGPYDE